MSVARLRLERLVDERARTEQNIEEVRATAETETRDLNEFEVEQVDKWRTRLRELDDEVGVLADDLERAENSRDVSKLLRDSGREEPPAVVEVGEAGVGPVVYRTFAAYARDQLIVRYPLIAQRVQGPDFAEEARVQATERLHRVQNTLSSNVAGLLPPQHMAQILDIINTNRPVVSSSRKVDLTNGKMTYPVIAQRPAVTKQAAEKTEAGTANMQVTLGDLTADTYLGGGNLSWQTINWSTPDALQLWFDLAAEAYARATETAACTSIGTAAIGTVTPALGTTGTETFAQWRDASLRALGAVYSATGGRARTNTLYLAANRFFSLAGLGDPNVTVMSPIGGLNLDTMTGTFNGLQVVGSFGFAAGTAIIGDSSAFLVAETPGAPIELRAVEPAIGGMEVGVIGAFQSKVYDPQRFLRLS
jgi:HK97 family phage major capsid protein